MGITVLIVDDDVVFSEMLKFALGRGGLETLSASDGAQALNLLQTQPVDIVLLDVMLPDMNGFAICRAIRSSAKLAEIPIIMLTARTQVSDKLNGFEAGVDDYVSKPVDPKEIIARIRALVARMRRQPKPAPRAVAFVGAKGGGGVSTVALNVALALARRQQVLLLEHGDYGPSSAWVLGLQPVQTLQGLAAMPGFRPTLSALQTCILQHTSGLAYLPARALECGPVAYDRGVISEVLSLLQESYGFMVLDLGLTGCLGNAEFLLHSSEVIPVVEYDPLAMWHLAALLKWLRQNGLENKTPGWVLVDRSFGPTKESPSALATQAGLGILGVIPAATDILYHANNRREPLYLASLESAAARAIEELAERLSVLPIQVAPELRP